MSRLGQEAWSGVKLGLGGGRLGLGASGRGQRWGMGGDRLDYELEDGEKLGLAGDREWDKNLGCSGVKLGLG